MFLIRIVLGMKTSCFVYIFKHIIKAYLNSAIGTEICVINNTDKLKFILQENPVIYFPKIIGALAP
jgi:hypothetical protein